MTFFVDCQHLVDNCAKNFDWNILISAQKAQAELAAHLLKIKPQISGSKLHIAICEEDPKSAFGYSTIDTVYCSYVLKHYINMIIWGFLNYSFFKRVFTLVHQSWSILMQI